MVTHSDLPGTAATQPPLMNRAILAGLLSPLHGLLDAGTTALRYRATDGREVTLPVGYVAHGAELVVLVGKSTSKTWWRHFRHAQSVELWWHGDWWPTSGQAFAPGTAQHDAAAAVYADRHHRIDSAADPFVVITLPAGLVGATPSRSAAHWWRTWTGWATAGEFCGFAVPAVVAAMLGDVTGPGGATLLVAAGAVEGALLGAAQAHVLQRRLPAIDRRQWILATSGAAALAWLIGLIPMLTNGFEHLDAAVTIPLAVVLGSVLLASIGTAQWWVLRRHVPHSIIWIFTTAGAWLVGLLAMMAVAMPLWQSGQAPALIAAIGALGGLVMAFTVAALTGVAFVWLCRRAR